MKTIVLAEDDAPTREFVVDVLAELEHCVVRAVAHGTAVLEVLETVRPDLLILDVNMPGLKGPEVYRLVRQRDELQAVPVLFMSAQDRQAVAELEGAYQWLAKPFEVDDLLRLVGDMVGRDVSAVLEETDAPGATEAPDA